jgi:hypothetical protein
VGFVWILVVGRFAILSLISKLISGSTGDILGDMFADGSVTAFVRRARSCLCLGRRRLLVDRMMFLLLRNSIRKQMPEIDSNEIQIVIPSRSSASNSDTLERPLLKL